MTMIYEFDIEKISSVLFIVIFLFSIFYLLSFFILKFLHFVFNCLRLPHLGFRGDSYFVNHFVEFN